MFHKVKNLGVVSACFLFLMSSVAQADDLQFYESKGVSECYILKTNKNRDYLYQLFDPYDRTKSEACVIDKLNKYAYECRQSNGESCYRYGLLIEPYEYYNPCKILLDKSSYASAYKSFQKACSLGNQKGCYKVGVYLKDGLGTRKDQDRGLTYLEQACNKSISQACMVLGEHYRIESLGVNPISESYYKNKAAKFYGKACDLGSDIGCSQYGLYK